jgi:hypothetical protein
MTRSVLDCGTTEEVPPFVGAEGLSKAPGFVRVWGGTLEGPWLFDGVGLRQSGAMGTNVGHSSPAKARCSSAFFNASSAAREALRSWHEPRGLLNSLQALIDPHPLASMSVKGEAQRHPRIAQRRPRIAQLRHRITQRRPRIAQRHLRITLRRPRITQRRPRITLRRPRITLRRPRIR